MNPNSARFQQRQERLNSRFNKAVREANYPEIIRTRFAMLGYSYSDDSGSGSALASISSAAASLGSAYILASQKSPNFNQNFNNVSVPTRINPAYGAAQPVGGSTVLWVVVAVAAIGAGLLFAFRS